MTKAKKEDPNEVKRSAKAVVKYVRIAPRKVRPVINTIRHQHPEKAFYILATLNKKGARMVEKLLKTACANAKVLGLDETRLVISDVRADGGPMMKRFMARSMGRADRILKRMTHLSMVLTESNRKFTSAASAQAKAEEAPKTEKAAKGKKKAAAAKA
jgi:large subunit ribosomal protein L22